MKKNVGQTDKVVRFILGVAFIVGGILLVQSLLWLAIIFFALALITVVTATVNLCPIYMMLGISTCKVKDASKEEQ